jgi:hypothetical protein
MLNSSQLLQLIKRLMLLKSPKAAMRKGDKSNSQASELKTAGYNESRVN